MVKTLLFTDYLVKQIPLETSPWFSVSGFPDWLQIDCLMVLFHFSQRSISWQSLITRVILCFFPPCFKDRHICPFLVFRDFLVVHYFSKIMTCEFVATSACLASTHPRPPWVHIIKFYSSEHFYSSSPH